MRRNLVRMAALLLAAFAAWMAAPASRAEAEEARWWINPQGGTRYHRVRCCPSIHPKYFDGMLEITEAQLKLEPYNMLSPCNVCRELDPAQYDLPQNQAPAASGEPADADAIRSRVIQNAEDYLTEVYGYPVSQAEKFIFLFHPEGELEYWPDEAHSAWCYRMYFDPATGETRDATTPFYGGGFENYPGESSVREVVLAFTEQDWLHQWNGEAVQAFSRKVYEWGQVVPTQRLAEGLQSGNITAPEAMREFFLSCFGPEESWTPAAVAWLKELLEEDAGEAGSPQARGDAPSHLRDEQIEIGLRNGSRVLAAYYVETIPEEAGLNRFTSKGWGLKEGILADYILPGENDAMQDTFDRGFFVLEKEGRRMGVTLIRKDGAWESHPAGPCVLADRDLTLTLQTGGPDLIFRLEYEPRDGKLVSCSSFVDGRGYLHLYNYSVTGEASGDRFLLYSEASGRWLWVCDRTGQESAGGGDPCYVSDIYAMLHFAELPDSPESYREWNRFPYLKGYYFVTGVHLREKTSSRSRDLGMLNPGTVVYKTGEAEGDPFPWYKVELGLLKGYVVTQYICADDAGQPTGDQYEPLPVAEAVRKADLKSGTGWLDGKIAEVPEGTRMHVLFERDGWYYVVIPREELHYYMDVEGQYGFIPKDAVRTGLTGYDLDWPLPQL